MGFVYPYLIVGCSDVSCHPSLSYLALGFAFLVFLFSFFLRLLLDRSLLLGDLLSTLLLPSGCVCSLVTCFAFLRVFSPGFCSVLSRSSCSLAWSFLAVFRNFVSYCLFMCLLLVIVSSAFFGLFLFLSFQLFPGCLSYVFWTSLGACPCCSSSVSFLWHRLHVLSCISFYPFLVCSPPPPFLGSSGFCFLCGVCFSCGSCYSSTFSIPFGLRFSACCGSGCSLWSFSAFFFPHAVASVDCFRSSSALFFRLLQFWLSLPVSLPLFRLLSLPVLYGLRPAFSASCASSFSLLLARFLLSSVLRVFLWRSLGCLGAAFPAFLLLLFCMVFPASFIFLPGPLGCISSLVSVPPSACCGVLRFFLRWFCLALLLWLYGCLFSVSFGSPVPVATWSPFGTSQVCFGLCLFSVSSCLPVLVSFLFLSPLRSSALFASGILFVSCSPGGLRLFSLVLSLVRCWFFPEAFLVPTRSCSFRPSSGSSLMSFRCSSLQSLLPFSSQFFVASLRLLFSVRGSLCPFLGRSSSLSSPPLSLPASGSFSFGLRLVQLCTFLGGWVASWVVSLLFLFAPSFVHEVLCFLSLFRISPFRLSLPWPVVSFHLVPSGFVLPLCFRTFLLGSSSALLSILSSGFFHHWAFPFLAHSRFLVLPRLVFSQLDVVGTFVYALRQAVLFLVSCHCPSGSCPSCGVPSHFFCGAVISLTGIRGFSCVACVFFHSASLIFAFAPWRLPSMVPFKISAVHEILKGTIDGNRFTIFSDSRSALLALRSDSSFSPILAETKELIRRAEEDIIINLCWVPGHIGDSSSKEFRVWLLMPSVLLVRQIPYRALSLGLKVVIRRWSRYTCLL